MIVCASDGLLAPENVSPACMVICMYADHVFAVKKRKTSGMVTMEKKGKKKEVFLHARQQIIVFKRAVKHSNIK